MALCIVSTEVLAQVLIQKVSTSIVECINTYVQQNQVIQTPTRPAMRRVVGSGSSGHVVRGIGDAATPRRHAPARSIAVMNVERHYIAGLTTDYVFPLVRKMRTVRFPNETTALCKYFKHKKNNKYGCIIRAKIGNRWRTCAILEVISKAEYHTIPQNAQTVGAEWQFSRGRAYKVAYIDHNNLIFAYVASPYEHIRVYGEFEDMVTKVTDILTQLHRE